MRPLYHNGSTILQSGGKPGGVSAPTAFETMKYTKYAKGPNQGIQREWNLSTL